jgi:hypothetical protein
LSLDPDYSERAEQFLDEIEKDPDRRPLWDAVCDAIDLVCDQPGSKQARRESIRHVFDRTVWEVAIRCPAEDDNHVLIWYPDGANAVILYIGPRPFR